MRAQTLKVFMNSVFMNSDIGGMCSVAQDLGF
jgi:hypothetical protein